MHPYRDGFLRQSSAVKPIPVPVRRRGRLGRQGASATSGADCWGQGFGSYNATSPTLPLADDVLNNQLLVTNLKCFSSVT